MEESDAETEEAAGFWGVWLGYLGVFCGGGGRLTVVNHLHVVLRRGAVDVVLPVQVICLSDEKTFQLLCVSGLVIDTSRHPDGAGRTDEDRSLQRAAQLLQLGEHHDEDVVRRVDALRCSEDHVRRGAASSQGRVVLDVVQTG